MVRDRTALTGLFLGALLASRLWAQDDKAQDDRATFTQDIRIVMTPVTVTDRSGIVINGLSPNDFRLLDNKKQQKITEDIKGHASGHLPALENLHVEVVPTFGSGAT